MTHPEDIAALVERLEAAKEGSRELDERVAYLLFGPPNPELPFPKAKPYTTSLDAALTLVPEGMGVNLHIGPRNMFCIAAITEPITSPTPEGGRLTRWKEHEASFPKGQVWPRPAALALCIAALKSRSAS